VSKDKEIELCPFCGKSWEKERRTHHEMLRVLAEAMIWTAATTVTLLIFKVMGI
jgi:hypothetical protein